MDRTIARGGIRPPPAKDRPDAATPPITRRRLLGTGAAASFLLTGPHGAPAAAQATPAGAPSAARPAAVVFDSYGTMFDVASVAEALAGLVPDPTSFAELWRAQQLEYTVARAALGPHAYVDWSRVTADALDFATESVGVRLSVGDKAQAMDGWMRVRPYPDASDAVDRLSRAGIPLGILSNGTPAMLESAVRNAGWDGRLAAVLSVDLAHTYKPNPHVYLLIPDAFGTPAGGVLFVSAHGFDVSGAKAAGLPVGWINRRAEPAPRLGYGQDFVFADLSAFADALLSGGLTAGPSPGSPR